MSAPLTPSERQRVDALLSEGRGDREVARRAGVAEALVTARRAELKAERKAEIAAHRARRQRMAPSAERRAVTSGDGSLDDRIRALVSGEGGQRLSTPQIARVLGIGESSVRRRRRAMRIAAKRPRGLAKELRTPYVEVTFAGGRRDTCEQCGHRVMFARAAGELVVVEPEVVIVIAETTGVEVRGRRPHRDVCLLHMIRDGRIAPGQPLPPPRSP